MAQSQEQIVAASKGRLAASEKGKKIAHIIDTFLDNEVNDSDLYYVENMRTKLVLKKGFKDQVLYDSFINAMSTFDDSSVAFKELCFQLKSL